MSHLDILLPFALPPAEMSADLLRDLHTPSLATLLSRAKSGDRRLQHEELDGFFRSLPHEIWLARQFGLGSGLKKCGAPPVATALMRSLGLQPASGTWFILQPVHLHVARDHLVLTDPRQLALDDAEARILFDMAKPLFDEGGKDLLYGSASIWFVRADDWFELQTSTPDAAAGHNIDIWMPTGPGERAWRKVQNEVQMHWFNHPINERREARRLKPVNSLWLWGGAVAAEHLPGRYGSAFNLSGWMQAFTQFVPHHASANTVGEVISASPDESLLVLDSLLEPALANDWSRWLEHMQTLEAGWFAPLLDALKSGAVEQLSFILTHDSRISRFTVTKPSLRKFWVKPTLATLCP
ncbi:MAG: hypothetical protein ACREX0_02585 [Noviherbaspirillum sp.]